GLAVPAGQPGLAAPELPRRAGVPGSAASTSPRSATHLHVHPAGPRLPRSSAPSFRRPSEHPGGLRLTRRGRVVLIAAATLLASLLGFGLASAAMATDHHVPAVPVHRGLSQVVVQPGQTLWSIAVHTDPSADPRLAEQRIIQLNGLSSSSIAAGQRLWIPQG
ncbi:MAG TPA: LysM peptidoglycan-binding domain-containing protein, partial [Streptosporangiaceae bacterium]|nr:LysM peptidoglycan-binding domain-containing protein [Streptosporangiaceae bacterium]